MDSDEPYIHLPSADEAARGGAARLRWRAEEVEQQVLVRLGAMTHVMPALAGTHGARTVGAQHEAGIPQLALGVSRLFCRPIPEASCLGCRDTPDFRLGVWSAELMGCGRCMS
jgi:hypothetical protein